MTLRILDSIKAHTTLGANLSGLRASGGIQSIPHGVVTTLTNMSAEAFDNAGAWDGTAFTANENGLFLYNWNCEFANLTNLFASLYIVSSSSGYSQPSTSLTDITGRNTMSDVVSLTAGQTLYFRVYHETTGSTSRNIASSRVSITRQV